MRDRISAAALFVNVQDRQDLPWFHALDADQICNSMSEHSGLARAGPCEDEEWPLPWSSPRAPARG